MDAMDGDGLYLAGHLAPPGRYRRVEPPDARVVVLERADVLPASLDGHIAVYQRFEPRRLDDAGDRPAPTRLRHPAAID